MKIKEETKKVVVYVTDDGKEFPTRAQATAHEDFLSIKQYQVADPVALPFIYEEPLKIDQGYVLYKVNNEEELDHFLWVIDEAFFPTSDWEFPVFIAYNKNRHIIINVGLLGKWYEESFSCYRS